MFKHVGGGGSTFFRRQVPELHGGPVAQGHGVLHAHVLPCLQERSEEMGRRGGGLKMEA